MPCPVQTPRFADYLRKLLGFKESRAFDVEDILLPVVSIVDPNQPDLAFHRGERGYAGIGSAAATVGQFSFVALENPTASSFLLVCDEVFAPTTGLPVLGGLLQSTGLGASAGAVKIPLDGRGWFVGSVAPGDIRVGSDVTNPNAAGTAFGYLINWSAVSIGPRDPRVVIPPGWSFVVKTSTVNTAANCGFRWRARPIETGEV